MINERRQGERRKSLRRGPDRRLLEGALGTPGLLRERIAAFVRKYGAESMDYMDRAVRDWYGPLENRTALIEACSTDAGLEEARRLVHAAGFRAAPLLPYVLRRYFGEPLIDERA
jgi:hypothetical protein